MDIRNRAFVGSASARRAYLLDILKKAKADDFVYPSMHLAERMAERNIDPIDVARMSVPIIKFFRETTYNDRSICVLWKDMKLAAHIRIGATTGKRMVLLKTVYGHRDRHEYDETFKVD